MPLIQYSNYQNFIRKHLKTASIVFAILLICGLLAFGISSVLWFIFELPGEIQSTPKPVEWSWKPFIKTSTQTKDLPPAASCGKRIVGYYTEWESPEITVKQLRRLTHVIFLFVAIYEDGSAKFWDEHGEDRFSAMKEMSLQLKNIGLKVMIGVGGFMVSPRFGPIVADSVKRKKLIKDIIAIVNHHNLDGVEIFWVYPGESNRRDYLKFIKELRGQLSNLEQSKERIKPYILSIVAPKFKLQLKDGYDLSKLLEYVDFIDVLTYDYFNTPNGSENKKFGPNSPLYGGNGRDVDETMKYLVCETRKPERINMAVSFYGNFWKNVENPIGENRVWKNTESSSGAVRWRELERSGWNKSAALWHEPSKSSFIWIPESKTFLGFENERSLKEKTKYAKEKDLGGFVIWAIDQDDDDYTLLNVLSSADLCTNNITDVVKYKC